MKAPGPKGTNESPRLSESNHQGQEWKLVQRIVATPPFLRSAFLTNFLLYICDRKLLDLQNEITEHQIGVQALGRPSAYHQGEDNIVRNYARMLRKRLEEHFAGEGREETLRIVIPRGQYVPVFEANPAPETTASSTPAEPAVEPGSGQTTHTPARRFSFTAQTGLVATVIALCLAAGWIYRSHQVEPRDLYRQFWHEIFNSGRTTDIVTADGGIQLLEDMTGREVHLSEYVNDDMDKWFPQVDTLKLHDDQHFDADRFSNYTSVADLNAVAEILRVPEISAARAVVSNARDIRMNDLLQSNVILLGGPHANPWVELFEPISAFRIEFSARLDDRSIANKHPRPGEQAAYLNVANADPHLTYTILSFLPSSDGNGHALLIQGLSMASTQAGANFVLNQKAMAPILKKAQLQDGTIGRFEVLLETQAVGHSAPAAHAIVERYGAADTETGPKRSP
ncbi:MAG: hypothetical protein ABI076_11375 [Acidobacteriaceae bacterium]